MGGQRHQAHPAHEEGTDLPTPNYAFEKRQRELAKKRKKEEKLKRRAELKHGAATAETPEAAADEPDAPDAVEIRADEGPDAVETPADEAPDAERE
ncbi:hypothetical protein [Schlegelella aquatica]|uniref:hypothetical protein n=1 Tax=Caldimonas aquatica TaxID=376175 RepID=UPI0037531D0E